MSNKSNMVIKTVSVLRAFTDIQQEWGVNELARFMSLPASSLHRILKSLRDEGILMMHPKTHKYTFGNELIRLSSIVQSKSNLCSIAKPIIQQLSQQLDETIYLALYYPQHFKLAFIDIVQSSRKLQYMLELGIQYTIHAGASGKSIMSQLSTETIDIIIEQEKLNAVDGQKLKEALQVFKQQGFAETLSERQSDSYGISFPFFNALGEVVGSITYGIPLPFFLESRKSQLIEEGQRAATLLSSQLGYNER